MLLQYTTPRRQPLNLLQEDDKLVRLSSTIPNALSFPYGLLEDPIFVLRHRLTLSRETHKNRVLITRSSASNVHNYGTYDYEKRPMLNWNAIYRKISMMPDPEKGAASVLNQVENEGKKLTKWELSRIVKELRKFRRFKYALEVYEWMNNRPERFRVTTSDTAIQLDLIAKVHGISTAEKYFRKLPETLKDKRIYGSLLNAYARAKLRQNAEALMGEMRRRGFANHSLPFNVMMTLYANLDDHDMIESLVSEMKEKNIAFDIYTYNIWLSSRGSRGSVEEMERVFAQMEMDPSINPNWTTYSTMATVYVKLEKFDKAEECLKKVEGRVTGRDRIPYHYLISLYGSARKKEDVYRIWDTYKASFANVTNLGYHSIVSSLVRMGDVEGAEKVYEEWVSSKSSFDARIGNLLLGAYVRGDSFEKAEAFFDQMVEVGGKPNAMTWEILAENRLKRGKISEALSCLKNAAECEGTMKWRPKPMNVSNILKVCDENGDMEIKDVLMDILRRLGCLDDEKYMSYVPFSVDGKVVSASNGSTSTVDSDGDESPELLDQLQQSF